MMTARYPNVICPYCKKSAQLVRGKHGLIWQCVPCDAHVKAYDNSPTKQPMGPLANAELREAKRLAHAAFDPLWQAAVDRMFRETGKAGDVRARAYKWLAGELGIEPKDCHFAMFNLTRCREVVRIVQRHTPPFMHGAARA